MPDSSGRRILLDENVDRLLALYHRIDEILWEEWDPIGVNDEPAARDEYHDYLPHVFQLAMSREKEDKLIEYLDRCATERMGLEKTHRESKRVARLIGEARSEYLDQ